MKRRYYYII